MNEILNIQIDFLVWLQNIRDTYFHGSYGCFLEITKFGEFFITTIICAITYWCINKRAGIFLYTVFSLGIISSQFLKMCACIYRPWILSDKVNPVPDAVPYAKGYSFPSGHSTIVTTIFGGIAYLLKRIYYVIPLGIMILLVMFSRMWLGVHTPQDVLTGLLLGLILIFLTNPIINKCRENKQLFNILAILLNILTLISIIFVCYKNYPIDYVNGKLIVNAITSIKVYIVCVGFALGLLDGVIICQKYFPFSTKSISVLTRFLRGIFGIILLCGIFQFVENYCFKLIFDNKMTLILTFLSGFMITGVYPFVFRTVENLLSIKTNKE